VANLPPVSLTPVTICHQRRYTGGKFAAIIVDTGGKVALVSTMIAKMVEKFAARVNDTGVAP
jgi:hypothetical protein